MPCLRVEVLANGGAGLRAEWAGGKIKTDSEKHMMSERQHHSLCFWVSIRYSLSHRICYMYHIVSLIPELPSWLSILTR